MTSPRRVLVVEDEQNIADVVEFALRENGFEVVTSSDGDAGLAAFRARQPALVILDLQLPGLHGLDLLRKLREERATAPVIILTSRTDETDRVTGLELGADDYVTKPFSPRELVARVRAVLRRAGRPLDGAAPIEVGPLTINPDSFTVTYLGRELAFSRNEFRLLERLTRHPARVYGRDALIDAIHDGDDGAVTDRSVDAQVKRIRSKFKAVPGAVDPVESVYGIGYRLSRRLEEQV